MIQDDSQAKVCKTQPEKMKKLNKCFLETEDKVWVLTFVNQDSKILIIKTDTLLKWK